VLGRRFGDELLDVIVLRRDRPLSSEDVQRATGRLRQKMQVSSADAAQQWQSSGNQVVIKWQSSGNQVAIKWQSSGNQVAIKWQSVAIKWQSCGNLSQSEPDGRGELHRVRRELPQ
jgi:hypothetical protein